MNQNEIKIVGIACDNYKVNKFRKTLSKKGFKIKDIVKFTEEVQIIQIECPVKSMFKLKGIIETLDTFFKSRN